MATSSAFSTTNKYIKYNITVTESNVNTAKNTSDVTVSIKFWRTNTGYTTYGTGTVYCTIDGTAYTASVTTSQKITHSGIVLFKKKVTIKHGSNGAKSLSVKAKISHSRFSSDYHTFTTALTTIVTAPSAPTNFSISAGFSNYVGIGDTINLSWAGASGTITGYELQRMRNGVWSAWKTQTGTSTTDSITSTDVSVSGAGKTIKYRVRALNGSYASAWKESNVLTILGGIEIKANNAWKTGSVWINVNGSWKRAKRVWIKVNGVWKYSV